MWIQIFGFGFGTAGEMNIKMDQAVMRTMRMEVTWKKIIRETNVTTEFKVTVEVTARVKVTPMTMR